MEPEDRISLVFGILSQAERPLSFGEIEVRTDWRNDSGVAFALGALAVRKRIGHTFFFDFVVMAQADFVILMPPDWRTAVLAALQQGPATFSEINDRVADLCNLDIGFVLGWLYAEGKVVFHSDKLDSLGRWQLAE